MWRCSASPEIKVNRQKGGYQKIKNVHCKQLGVFKRIYIVRRIIIKEITVNAAIIMFQYSLRLDGFIF